ncbi:MAG TPA: DNA replication/repair protein RecF [Gammaproteobacteria bacterium]|nr:DNA replication/repair protein RecF [Gammaproteobacteria bacterium]
MVIQRLQIGAFRNIEGARVEPEAGLNRLIGPNGAGKTSVLEAIHYLASGRSFRQVGPAGMRREGSEEATLFAQVSGGAGHRIGARLTRGGRVLRLDGQTVSGFAALAGVLKTIHYTPEGHRLADGGPRERRRFLDWGLFHVEPPYLELARRYQRALHQRNRWLKSRPSGPDPWAADLAASGEEMAARRAGYVTRLEGWAASLFGELGGFGGLGMRLERGWPEAVELREALERDRAREADTTRVGPHRADLVLTLDGAPARERASRGQQKVVVLALRLAQLALATEETGEAPVFLFDDVASELDAQRRTAAMALLERFGEQVFVTSTEEALCPLPAAGTPAATFRVRDGTIERSD